jgi:transcriptional regulator with XRE-family HTH domain
MNTIQRIEKLLIEHGVAPRKVRRELADACGVSYQAVRDWFNGDTQKISPDYLAIIAKKWGTTSDYLITGDKSGVEHAKAVAGERDWVPQNATEYYDRYGAHLESLPLKELIKVIGRLEAIIDKRLENASSLGSKFNK